MVHLLAGRTFRMPIHLEAAVLYKQMHVITTASRVYCKLSRQPSSSCNATGFV